MTFLMFYNVLMEVYTIKNIIEIDKITEEEKDIYKKTYELKDYTGYLPYIMLIEKNKLLVTKTDIYKLEDLKKIIKKNSN